jgi:hypothetical protein
VLHAHGDDAKAGVFDPRENPSRRLGANGIWFDDGKRTFHMSDRF